MVLFVVCRYFNIKLFTLENYQIAKQFESRLAGEIIWVKLFTNGIIMLQKIATTGWGRDKLLVHYDSRQSMPRWDDA